MQKWPILLCVTCSSLLFASCSMPTGTQPVFPESAGARITSLSQFDQIVSDVEGQRGKAIQLAGAVERIDQTDEGYKALVSWLPYPEARRVDKGPRLPKVRPVRRYVIFFRGKVPESERPFFLQGNVFVVDGSVKGTEEAITDIFGTSQELLAITANCVRMWETGISSPIESDTDYPLPVARTYCATP